MSSSNRVEFDFKELKKVLDQIPVSPPKPKFRCTLSGKEISEEDVIIHDTGVTTVKEYLHPDFLKEVKGLSKTACITCAKVVAYLKPKLDEEGFLLESDKIYHIRECPDCNPAAFYGKTVETPLIEKQIFLERKNNKQI